MVPGNVSALFGMWEFERLQLLSINCQTTANQQKRRQINEQTKQDKSKASNSFKNDLHTNNKFQQEIGYFAVRAGMEADRVVSVETTLKICKEYSGVFTGTGTFLCRSKMSSHTKCCLGT